MKNSNGYYFALSGMKMGVAKLNETLEEQRAKLQLDEVKPTIENVTIKKLVYNVTEISKPYEGVFLFDSGETYQDQFLNSFYTNNKSKEYEFQVDTQWNKDISIKWKISLEYDVSKKGYLITSTATNVGTTIKDGRNVSVTLLGLVKMHNPTQKEILLERYGWKDQSVEHFTSYGALTEQPVEQLNDSILKGEIQQGRVGDVVNAEV